MGSLPPFLMLDLRNLTFLDDEEVVSVLAQFTSPIELATGQPARMDGGSRA